MPSGLKQNAYDALMELHEAARQCLATRKARVSGRRKARERALSLATEFEKSFGSLETAVKTVLDDKAGYYWQPDLGHKHHAHLERLTRERYRKSRNRQELALSHGPFEREDISEEDWQKY